MEINYYVWMYFILIRNFGLFFFIIGILMNNVKSDFFVERWENLLFCLRFVYMILKSVIWIIFY